jgi:hypothetical protein
MDSPESTCVGQICGDVSFDACRQILDILIAKIRRFQLANVELQICFHVSETSQRKLLASLAPIN